MSQFNNTLSPDDVAEEIEDVRFDEPEPNLTESQEPSRNSLRADDVKDQSDDITDMFLGRTDQGPIESVFRGIGRATVTGAETLVRGIGAQAASVSSEIEHGMGKALELAPTALSFAKALDPDGLLTKPGDFNESLFKLKMLRSAFVLGVSPRLKAISQETAKPFEALANEIAKGRELSAIKKIYNVNENQSLSGRMGKARWWIEQFPEGAGTAVLPLVAVGATKIVATRSGMGAKAASRLGIAIGSTMAGLQEGGSSFEDMRDSLREKGYSEADASAIAARGQRPVAIASGLVERGILPIQTANTRRWAARVLTGAVSESAEETAQYLLSGIGRMLVGLDPEYTAEELILSNVFAAGGGAAVNVFSRGPGKPPEPVTAIVETPPKGRRFRGGPAPPITPEVIPPERPGDVIIDTEGTTISRGLQFGQEGRPRLNSKFARRVPGTASRGDGGPVSFLWGGLLFKARGTPRRLTSDQLMTPEGQRELIMTLPLNAIEIASSDSPSRASFKGVVKTGAKLNESQRKQIAAGVREASEDMMAVREQRLLAEAPVGEQGTIVVADPTKQLEALEVNLPLRLDQAPITPSQLEVNQPQPLTIDTAFGSDIPIDATDPAVRQGEFQAYTSAVDRGIILLPKGYPIPIRRKVETAERAFIKIMDNIAAQYGEDVNVPIFSNVGINSTVPIESPIADSDLFEARAARFALDDQVGKLRKATVNEVLDSLQEDGPASKSDLRRALSNEVTRQIMSQTSSSDVMTESEIIKKMMNDLWIDLRSKSGIPIATSWTFQEALRETKRWNKGTSGLDTSPEPLVKQILDIAQVMTGRADLAEVDPDLATTFRSPLESTELAPGQDPRDLDEQLQFAEDDTPDELIPMDEIIDGMLLEDAKDLAKRTGVDDSGSRDEVVERLKQAHKMTSRTQRRLHRRGMVQFPWGRFPLDSTLKRESKTVGGASVWLGRLTHQYTLESMFNRVRDIGGASGARAAEMATLSIDKTKATLGELGEPYVKALKATGGLNPLKLTASVERLKAVSRLQRVTTIPMGNLGSYGMNRFPDAVEGHSQLDAEEQKVIDFVREFMSAVGQHLQREGYKQINKVTGQVQSFIHKGGKVMPRMWTMDMYGIIMRGSGDLWDLMIASTAHANGISQSEVAKTFDKIRTAFIGSGNETGDSPFNAEIIRMWKKFPTEITPPNGDTVQLIETHPYTVVRRTNDNVASRTGFVSQFGQSISGDDTYKKLRDAYKAENGTDKPLVEIARALNNIPVEIPILTAGSHQARATRTLVSMGTILKSGLLSGTAPINLTEFMGSLQASAGGSLGTGFTDFMRASYKIFGGLDSHRQLVAFHNALGSITADIADLSFDPNRKFQSIARIIKQGAGKVFTHQYVNEHQELGAAAIAQEKVERAQNGKGERGDIFDFRLAGFSRETAERMSRGGGTSAEYNRYVRIAPGLLVGSALRSAERSRAQNNNFYKGLILFDTYARAKLLSTARAVDVFQSEMRHAHSIRSTNMVEANKRMQAAGMKFTRFVLGTAAQGALGQFVVAFLLGGRMGLDQEWNEFKDKPLRFMADGFLYSTFAGPFGAFIRASSGNKPFVENIWRATLPGFAFGEIADAWSSRGRYADRSRIERFGQLIHRVWPVSQYARSFGAAIGLGDETHKIDVASKAYWRWRYDEHPPGSGSAGELTAADKEFRRKMRLGRDAAFAGDEQKAQRLFIEALNVDGKSASSVRTSIQGRRLLVEHDKTQLKELLDRVGETTYRQLVARDSILDSWAVAYGANESTITQHRALQLSVLQGE